MEPTMARTKSQSCHLKILDAAADVMEERGYLAMSIEEVACRAKAGKQTVYRHFSSKPRLALEAFVHRAAKRVDLPDTGSLLGDLQTYLNELATAMGVDHKRQMLAGLVAEAQTDPALAALFREEVIAAKQRSLRTVFQRGIARAEVDADTDLDVLVDLVYGPIWYRLLISAAPLDAAFTTALAASVTRAAKQ